MSTNSTPKESFTLEEVLCLEARARGDQLTDDQISRLVALTDSGDSLLIRTMALRVLAQVKKASWRDSIIGSLVRHMADSYPEISMEAAQGLATVGAEFEEVARHDPLGWYTGERHAADPFVSYAMELEEVRTLQSKAEAHQVNDSEIQRLIVLSNFPQFYLVRVKALSALWYVSDPQWRQQVIGVLADRLGDPHHLVRIYAVSGLAKHNARERVPDLLSLLKGSHPGELRIVRKALAKLSGQIP